MEIVQVPTVKLNASGSSDTNLIAIGKDQVRVTHPYRTEGIGHSWRLFQDRVELGCQTISIDEIKQAIAVIEGTESPSQIRGFFKNGRMTCTEDDLVTETDEFLLFKSERWARKSDYEIQVVNKKSILIDHPSSNDHYQFRNDYHFEKRHKDKLLADLKEFNEFFDYVKSLN